MAAKAELRIYVGDDWGSRRSTSSDSPSISPTLSRCATRSSAGLWNGLEPGPILSSSVGWPPDLQQPSKLESKLFAHSRRATEAESVYGHHASQSEHRGQSREEQLADPSFLRSKSERFHYHHLSVAERKSTAVERRSTAVIEERDEEKSPRSPRAETFHSLLIPEKVTEASRSRESPRALDNVEDSVEAPGWSGQEKQVYQRLYTHARARETLRKKRQELKERQELEDVTGQPSICPQSKSMLRQARSFEERLAASQARARFRAQVLKEEVEAKRTAEEARHCHPPRITRLSKKLSRGVTHLSEWEKHRLERLAAAMEEKQRKEEEALTFSPTLSRRSRKLVMRTFRQPPRLRLLELAKPRPVSPPRPPPSFRPTINPTSAALYRPGSITDRLHYQSHAWHRRKASSQHKESHEEPYPPYLQNYGWFSNGPETWDAIWPSCQGGDPTDARDWSEATAYGSNQVEQSPGSARARFLWAHEDRAFRRHSWEEEPPPGEMDRADGLSGQAETTSPTSPLGEPITEARDFRPSPLRVSDPVQSLSPDAREDQSGARDEAPGGEGGRVSRKSVGLRRSKSFREDPKEREKWRTIKERIQSGPKHWHLQLHVPEGGRASSLTYSEGSQEKTEKREHSLARTLTMPANLRQTSFVEDLEREESTECKAPLEAEMNTVPRPPQAKEEVVVTKVPYNAKYRCLFAET